MVPWAKNAFVKSYELLLKIGITCGESVCAILAIIFGIRVILNLGSGQYYETNDLLLDASFQITISAIVLFFICPSLIRYILNQIEIQQYKQRVQQFRNKFLTRILNVTRFSVEEIIDEFHIHPEDIDRAVEDLIRKGLLRGSFIRLGTQRIFEIAPEFTIMTPEERKKQHFRERIPEITFAYKTITFEKLAQIFEISTSMVEELLIECIGNHILPGKIEAGTYINP
jgi:hypothetical protein